MKKTIFFLAITVLLSVGFRNPTTPDLISGVTGSVAALGEKSVTVPATEAALAAWNCRDHSYNWNAPANPVICVTPSAAEFRIRVTNMRINGASLIGEAYEDSPLNVVLESTPGCIKTPPGCTYKIGLKGGTFGPWAEYLGQNLFPEAPEIQEQGVVVWLHAIFQPGPHEIEVLQ